jgi:hypothetical protein
VLIDGLQPERVGRQPGSCSSGSLLLLLLLPLLLLLLLPLLLLCLLLLLLLRLLLLHVCSWLLIELHISGRVVVCVISLLL